MGTDRYDFSKDKYSFCVCFNSCVGWSSSSSSSRCLGRSAICARKQTDTLSIDDQMALIHVKVGAFIIFIKSNVLQLIVFIVRITGRLSSLGLFKSRLCAAADAFVSPERPLAHSFVLDIVLAACGACAMPGARHICSSASAGAVRKHAHVQSDCQKADSCSQSLIVSRCVEWSCYDTPGVEARPLGAVGAAQDHV